ncbi:MAG: exodeoxyribonuclease V subunit gamma, partial [Balneolaceae bacterium]
MYHLIASSSLRTLSESFCRSLTEVLPEDPLDPVTVIVPNRDLSRWLSMEIARQQGVMGNIRYLLPSEWFWQRVRTLFPGLPKELPSDRGALKWILFRILSEEQERKKLPATLRSWLERQPAREQERLWDLSGVVASLFDQYQIYRPDLVNDWSRGTLQGSRDEEKWQAFLWKRIDDKWKTLDDNSLKYHRGEFFDILYQDIVTNEPAEGSLILFNPGLISPPLVRLFMEQARHCQVRHYITCSFASVLGQEGSWPEWENPMLSSMAGEQVALISQLKKEAARSSQTIDWISLDRNDRGLPGSQPTLLGKVRHSIHTNRPMPKGLADDGTIEVHSCHSTLREVETLYDYLLRQFEELEDLRADQ